MNRLPLNDCPELLAVCIAAPLIAFAVFMGNAHAQSRELGNRGGPLPVSPATVYPSRCDVPYTLGPGERAVLLCIAPVPRGGLEGIAQFESGHESVDVSIVRRLPLGRVVFAVTNRSAEPVTATARGEQW